MTWILTRIEEVFTDYLRTTLVLLSLHRLISWLLRRISYYTSTLYVIKYHNIKPTIPCPLFSQNYSMADFKKWLNKGHDCIFIFTTCPLFRFVSSFSLFSHAGIYCYVEMYAGKKIQVFSDKNSYHTFVTLRKARIFKDGQIEATFATKNLAKTKYSRHK